MIEVFLDGEVTITGDQRADLWHPSLVVLSDEVGVIGMPKLASQDQPTVRVLRAEAEALCAGAVR